MGTIATSASEQLLRRLAAGDEDVLRSVLAVAPTATRSSSFPAQRGLPEATRGLVRLSALVAAGGSTTSLRWAVELASRSGADDAAIVEVLVTTASIVGGARVVAEAPRLALAIGYDLEVDGWDGD